MTQAVSASASARTAARSGAADALSDEERIAQIHRERSFIGHPCGTGSLSLLNLGMGVGHGSINAILIYYMYASAPGGLGFSQTEAAQIFSLYSTFIVLCGLVGSYVADRILGPRRGLRYARLGQVIGFMLLMFPFLGIAGTMASLTLLSVSAMFGGRSLEALLGMLYAEGDGRRAAAFTMTYVFSNIAGIFTPLIVGTIAQYAGYWAGFAFGAVFALAGWLLYFLTEKRFFGPLGLTPGDPIAQDKRRGFIVRLIVIVVAAVAVVATLFIMKVITISAFSNAVSTAAIFIPLVYLAYIIKSRKTSRAESHHVIAILPLFACNAVAMWVWTQTITIISIYSEKSVDRNLFGFEITPAAFQTWGSFLAVAFGTLFVTLWTKLGSHQPSNAAKMGFSTIMYAAGPLLMTLPFTLYPAGVKVSPLWVLVFWLLIMIGEASGGPAGYAAASDVAPKAFATQMMTVWALSQSTGSALNSLSINFYHEGSEATYFLFVGGVTAVLGILVLVFSKKLTHAMGVDEASLK